MLIPIILIAVACLLPAVLFGLTRRRSAASPSPGDLTSQLLPVDVEAFCNLVDPEEEQFLRSNLPPSLFRSVQRERLRAAAEYVSAVSHNAVILTRLGSAVRNYEDATVSQAAQELSNSAVRLRLHCLLVTLNLWTAIALPGAALPATSFVERYQQLNGLARRLGRLRYPSTTSEVSAR
jgi:hypothetical protein